MKVNVFFSIAAYTILGFVIGLLADNLLKHIADNSVYSEKQEYRNTLVYVRKTPERLISEYDCIIRNSTDPDTIRWYQQKKLLLLDSLKIK